MLRSIVAIWSLAFTLIFVAVFAGGCEGSRPATGVVRPAAIGQPAGDFGFTPPGSRRLDAPRVMPLASVA